MHAHTVTLGGYRHRMYASTPPAPKHAPLLALHGFGLDGLRSFRPVARPLQRHGVAVYALDLLGFGASAAPNRVYSLKLYASLVAEAADVLDGAPVLIGHSMGGKIAAAAAALHPHRFAGVLLINPGGFSWMAPWLPALASHRWVSMLLQQPWMRRCVLSRLPMGHFLAHPTTIEQALRLRDSHRALDLDATGLRPRLRMIHRPVGVIWGLSDSLLPPSTLDRLRIDLPQALVYRLARAGHVPMWDQPDAFTDRVVRFFARTA